MLPNKHGETRDQQTLYVSLIVRYSVLSLRHLREHHSNAFRPEPKNFNGNYISCTWWPSRRARRFFTKSGFVCSAFVVRRPPTCSGVRSRGPRRSTTTFDEAKRNHVSHSVVQQGFRRFAPFSNPSSFVDGRVDKPFLDCYE